MTEHRFSDTAYGKITGVYDWLDRMDVFSAKTRNLFLNTLPFVPENPLEIGCGTGNFAYEFVVSTQPKRFTVSDLSEKMLDVTCQRLASSGWHGELRILPGDVMSCTAYKAYDLIMIHFVLNMFPVNCRIAFLQKVASLLTDEGIIWVADYNTPQHFVLLPLFHVCWSVTVIFFWIFAGNKPNLLGDMESSLVHSGFQVIRKKSILGGFFSAFLLKKDDLLLFEAV